MAQTDTYRYRCAMPDCDEEATLDTRGEDRIRRECESCDCDRFFDRVEDDEDQDASTDADTSGDSDTDDGMKPSQRDRYGTYSGPLCATSVVEDGSGDVVMRAPGSAKTVHVDDVEMSFEESTYRPQGSEGGTDEEPVEQHTDGMLLSEDEVCTFDAEDFPDAEEALGSEQQVLQEYDRLTDISGVGEDEAHELGRHGILGPVDCYHASQQDLAHVVGNALAARIKADFGTADGCSDSAGSASPNPDVGSPSDGKDDGDSETESPSETVERLREKVCGRDEVDGPERLAQHLRDFLSDTSRIAQALEPILDQMTGVRVDDIEMYTMEDGKQARVSMVFDVSEPDDGGDSQ
jgi:predicted flap endonuclease-1-like 5' DNA nuclease